jgi:hypothetical protein
MAQRGWLFAACAAAGLVGSLTAIAETPAEPNISGSWKFKTAPLPSNACIISGDITISSTPTPNVWSCEFISREDCGAGDAASFQKVAQSCQAVTVGKAVEITSKVKAMLDAGPPERREDLMTPNRYRADDFSVTLQPSGVEMTGRFHSLQAASVRFWRVRDLTS